MPQDATPPLPGYTIFDPHDPFETRAGPFWCAQQPDGRLEFALEVTENQCNSNGITHGGMLMTMIDLTLVATAKTVPEDRFVTVSLNSEFIASAKVGDLIQAEGTLTRRTRSLAFVRGQVRCGDRILLTASAVLKHIAPRQAPLNT